MLERFVEAQDRVWAEVLAELAAGAKRTHWMWFVFPQIAGLGRSPTARFYAIDGLAEARAYLAHPVLGPRLDAALAALGGSGAASAEAVFGTLDAMKLRSSLTLFATVDPRFGAALDRWFGGERDPATLALIG